MEIELYVLEAEEKMEKIIDQFQKNISKISAGRANPQILNDINIMYFENPTPINQVASITVPEGTQLLVKPYEPKLNKEIINAINSSNLGVTIQDEGDKTRIIFPQMTLERRKELVKSLSSYTEQSKVQTRLVRQDLNKEIKKEELPKDQEKYYHDEIQKITDKFIEKINSVVSEKEKELLTI